MSNTFLEIRNLAKSYRNSQNFTNVFSNFNLDVLEGEFLSILGPNGCGKTTLLNIASGLVAPDRGEIKFALKDAIRPRIGFLFQNFQDSLFPWLTAWENIVFPLKIAGMTSQEKKSSVDHVADKCGINFDLSKYPYQLSGGQQQLVAMARNLIIEPHIFLLVTCPQSTYQSLCESWLHKG